MPVKTVVCALCGETVTKRSTLDLQVLKGTVRGRACRTHEEVISLRQDVLNQNQLERLYTEANETFQVITAVEMVRIWHTLHGYPIELMYARFRQSMSESVVRKIREGVETKGARLSPLELNMAFAAMIHLRERTTGAEVS